MGDLAAHYKKASGIKEIRNIYGEPLPAGKSLKYNNTRVYDLMTKILRRDSEGRCINAFKVLSNPGILKLAYESIKSKSGNMVRGTDNETLEGISNS